MKNELIKIIFIVILASTAMFYTVGAHAMNISSLFIGLNIDLDNNRDLLDLNELSKKAEFRKMPKYVAFGLPVPEIVFEEAIAFAKKEGDPLSQFVLQYPYAPLVVMYWDTIKLYKNRGNKTYPTFEKFIESFTIRILKEFEKTPADPQDNGYLEIVRNPQKEGVALTLIDVLQFIEINKKNYTKYNITNLEKILWPTFSDVVYVKSTDFNIYDIIYDILYNNIARILTESYKDKTIKKVLPIHQAWFEYKIKHEMWETNGSSSHVEPHVVKPDFKLTVLYPRAISGGDIKDFYVAKARSRASSGLGIGYDELYEFLVDNRPKALNEIDFRAMWGSRQPRIPFQEYFTNNIKQEIPNIFYEYRFYRFDGSFEQGNGNTYTRSLVNHTRSTFDLAIYYRYTAIQCLNMLFFDAYAVNRGK